MSAIFGVINRDARPVDPTSLAPMSASMAHRGTDDQRVWVKGAIGIGHRMMRTTPESLGEKQPFQDNESGLVISADARIDNRAELGKKLGLVKQVNSGIPDSNLILSAYKKWMDKCVDHLLGDYAFVIWDQRRNRLFCARDHMGLKPFNYYVDQNRFVFATEVQAILKEPGVPKTINEGRIADFIVGPLEGIDKISTFFKEIYRLPPAHTLILADDKVRLRCYWRPDPDKRIVLNSQHEYVDAFNEIYTESIRARLRSNNDCASMLSGGMDSSSIVGIARELHRSTTGNPFPVFSGVSDNKPDCRETHFINSMLNQGGLSATTISAEELGSLSEEINQIVKTAQEPFDSMVMITAIYLLANKSGFRVLLDGIGGDEIVSLSAYYPAILLRDGRYREAIRAMRLQNHNFFAGEMGFSRILYKDLRIAYTPSFMRKMRGFLFPGYRYTEQIKNSFISDEFANEIHLVDRLEQLYAHGCKGLCDSFYKMHTSAIDHPYLTVGMERYDRVAALCGIEPRRPLLDKRLIDFMVAVPWDQKVGSGWNKYLLRKASEQVLPRDVCWRRGRSHVGWTFEQKWLEMNITDIISNVRAMSGEMRYYLKSDKLTDIITSYRVSDRVLSAGSRKLLPFNNLYNWHKIRGVT